MFEKGLPLKSTSGCRLENVAWQTERDGRPIFALVAVVNERVWCQNCSTWVANLKWRLSKPFDNTEPGAKLARIQAQNSFVAYFFGRRRFITNAYLANTGIYNPSLHNIIFCIFV